MSLSEQDLENIATAIAKANDGFTPSLRRTAAICFTITLFAIGSVVLGTSHFNRFEDKMDVRITSVEDKMDERMTSIEGKLDEMGVVLAHIDERTKNNTSTDTHSRTPNQTADDSVKPE